MSLVRFKAQNHPQQRTREDVDDRATTPEVFGPLHARFAFTVDAAAAAHNTKLPRYWDREADGLAQSWAGEHVWCNPPYSAIAPWVEKAWSEDACPLVVMLLPANRTEQRWWQDLVEPFRDRAGGVLRVEFLAGRMRFLRRGATEIGPNERPPFGVCLLIWDRRTALLGTGGDLLALIDQPAPERIPCPRCGRMTCLTPLGRICGHGRRDSPCRGSWLTEREARRAVRLARGGRA